MYFAGSVICTWKRTLIAGNLGEEGCCWLWGGGGKGRWGDNKRKRWKANWRSYVKSQCSEKKQREKIRQCWSSKLALSLMFALMTWWLIVYNLPFCLVKNCHERQFFWCFFLHKKHLANNMEVFFANNKYIKINFFFCTIIIRNQWKISKEAMLKKHLAQYDVMTENKAISREALWV